MKTQAVTKSDVYSQGLKYTSNSDGKSYSVSGIGTCTDEDIIIPETYNNMPVTSIGELAFNNCIALTSIMIPSSVTNINNGAFGRCTGLTNITISNGVKSIGNYAFCGCKGLTSITIPNSVTSIGNIAFSGCTGLTSITIPDSVTSIGDSAFYYCEGLTSITIPNSVTSIGDCAFNGCTGLTSITIPSSVTSIGNYAFNNCIALTSITIPSSVTGIGYRAFSSCTGLTSINVDSKNTQYHSVNNCLIETVTKTLIAGCKNSVIPDDGSVTSIGDCAFYGCTGLTSITIPDSVTSIGESAFKNCSGLHKNGTFKATDKDMCCRQFQYNLGEKFETTHASLCHSGFHFCTNAFDLLNYYSGEIGRTVRFFEVKVDKVAEERDFDSKRVCKEITLLREIKSYAELLN